VKFPVGMKSHTVATVAVVVEARANERDAVELRQLPSYHRQRWRGEIVAWAVPLGEARLIDNALVHDPAVVTPRYGSDQLLAKRVSTE
jgi:pantothenate synthetase